ncbi:hypothetical protein [Marinoscillum pacificum]|uniref:hypothetical protein n=1 Tax=Marinoscillum pacificum TaxID=392723 RepID=UPI0021582A2A|nr:hypothetical protein [Marinoscillum pacificum]
MKKLNLLSVGLIFIVFGCTTNGIDEPIILEEASALNDPISCDINGLENVCAGSTRTYTFKPTSYVPTSFSWQVVSGNMSIVGSQSSNSVTVQFASNFTTGRLEGTGGNSNNESCTNFIDIDKIVDPTSTPQLSGWELIPGYLPNKRTHWEYEITNPISGVVYNWYVNGIQQTHTGTGFLYGAYCGQTTSVYARANYTCSSKTSNVVTMYPHCP